MAREQTMSAAEIEHRLTDLPAWRYDGTDIRRFYETSGWPVTMMLVNALAFVAEAANHHPDLTVSWSKVEVRLHTHSANGITEKDFAVARRFDEVAYWQPPADSGLAKLAQKLAK